VTNTATDTAADTAADTATDTAGNIVDHRATGSTTIDLAIVIDAPADAVFDFLVDPDKLFRWIGRDGVADPVSGGAYRVRFDDENVAVGEYVDIVRPTLVTWTWGWEGNEIVPPGSTEVRFELIEDDGRTTVRVVHTGLPSVESADSHAEGWTYFGGRLAFEAARDALRAAELELMLDRERVAEMRRSLPPGPSVPDYEFAEHVDGTTNAIRLSQLFADPDKPLVVYHFMYGKRQEHPCPMCSMWTDGWNAVAHHLAERLNFVVAASSPADEWTRVAHDRGWDNLRLVSAAPSSFKLDVGGEDADGNQWPFISVYELVDGEPRLTYSGSAHISGDHWRGVDLLSPVWHFLDLTRDGRGDWMPS
jgi:predicted dithiol-disulfide oxidoreductase (DUF899 family)